MIPRYTRPKIEKIWSTTNKFSIWTEIECLIAEKLAINGTIPKEAAKEIRIAGRNTQGVRIIKLSGGEKVVSAIKIEDNIE